MKIEKRLRDFLHLKRTKLKQLYVWYCTNELYIQLYVCLSPYINIYISYIKCNVVTLYERILTCFIIYRNAILTFLTLFVKYVFEKKTVCTVLYVCLPSYIYIYISCIKCNVVTFHERILTCFIIYRNAISTFLTLFVKYVFEKTVCTVLYVCLPPYIYHT